jgi:pilus assembly protein CpaF
VSSIAEVTGFNQEGVTLGEIFRYERSGIDDARQVIGRFVPTGYRPQFLKRLQAAGVEAADEVFQP